jgi:hypothetical protein
MQLKQKAEQESLPEALRRGQFLPRETKLQKFSNFIAEEAWYLNTRTYQLPTAAAGMSELL